jgi:hypothetical protein
MPTNKVQNRERSVRRNIRAALKEGLVPKSIAPDGTVSLAAPSPAEVSLDLSRDIDDMIESERAKWGAKDDKTTP